MSPKITGCCLAALFAWTSPTRAESTALLPSKTNTLIQVVGSSAQQLSNGLGDIYVGRTNQDGQGAATISIRRGLITFDVADTIPAGATITGVTLAMEDVMGLNGNQTVSLSRLFRDWGQGTSFFSGGQGAPATNGDATWYYTSYNAGSPSLSSSWSVPGGESGVDFSATASATSLVYAGTPGLIVSWSSTSSPAMVTDVQQWLDSPATNFGWIMLGNESAGQTAQRFGGEYPTAPETPPKLTIQYDSPCTWTGGAGNATWSASGNWTSGTGLPGSGAAIVLGGSQAISGTVDLLSTAPSISHLTFDTNMITTITSTAPGGGRLTLDNGSFPVDVVVSGSGHMIDNKVAVTLQSDAWITTSGSSDSLNIAGGISNGIAAHGIVKDGLGTLTLSGSNNYSGGTTVDAGTLIVASNNALPAGSGLTVGTGGTVIFSAVTPGPSSWAFAGSGNWSDTSKWAGTVPNGVGRPAVLNPSTTAAVTVFLDTPVTLGTLQFGNPGGNLSVGYTVSGTNALTLDNNGTTSLVAVSEGAHAIAVPVTLNGNLDVSPSAGSRLTISGNISQSTTSASSLTLNNSGELVLSGSNTYTGGTEVDEGTLDVIISNAIPYGTGLTVGSGGTVIFADPAGAGATLAAISLHAASSAGSVAAVPEPGTPALLGVAGIIAAAVWRRRNGS